jgi:hypothetical protein
VNDWLLFNVKGANFQLYHGDNKLHFDEMMFALYLVNIRSWIFKVFSPWGNSLQGDMLLHPNTLSLLQANLSLLLLHNIVCLAEKQ